MSVINDYVSVVTMDRGLITTVSQEFVLQFYTIMNKHPGSLHRFYKEESVLVRDDVCAQGQADIHKAYMALGLSNCKAVVLSLDAVKAFGKSILIQVTGEVANQGEDLRRFMQSFVLVEQDLGNFYVLNDIFRYQDLTFKAEDIEEAQIVDQEVKEDNHIELNSWNDVGRACESLNVEPLMQRSPIISESEERNEDFVQYKHIDEDLNEDINDNADEESIPELSQKVDEMAIKEKSWAAIISPMSNRHTKPTAPVAPQPQITKPAQQKSMNSNGDNFEKRRPRYNNSGPGKVPSSQASLNYPDEHQLFVGNLPQNMTEDELKDFFSANYGAVKEVRIQKSRSSNDGKPLPNFGFLVFHNHDVVEEILKNKPIYYISHRLNVEQKMGGSSRNSHKPMRR